MVMSGIAIVCQAYGTDPTGSKPSEMDKDVTTEAFTLATRNRDVEAFILQGGYSFGGGPTESELMAGILSGTFENKRIILEKESMNTLQGARAIRRIAEENEFEVLFVIGEWFHLGRITSTYYGVFRASNIALQFFEVRTPFGPNSQKRLQSAWRWWPWEILARVATPILIHLGK